MRILNAEPKGYSPAAKAILQEFSSVDEIELDYHGLLQKITDYEVLIVRLANQIDKAILDAGKKLQCIVTATTGLNHINIAYAQERGITVLSLKDEIQFLETVSATAEHTWGLLLALVRNLPSAFNSVRDGEWNRDLFWGHELDGKCLGILGLGRIGKKVARYAFAFQLSVIAYDPFQEQWFEGVTCIDKLDEFLARTDILSIHLPLNEQTENFIGHKELALLPKGTWLINTARGELVDEDALVNALLSGQLAGAAVDVVQHERASIQRNQSLLLDYARTHENLLITPHIGGAAYEAIAKTEIFMAEKLRYFLKGK